MTRRNPEATCATCLYGNIEQSDVISGKMETVVRCRSTQPEHRYQCLINPKDWWCENHPDLILEEEEPNTHGQEVFKWHSCAEITGAVTTDKYWHVGMDADGNEVQRHLEKDCKPTCPLYLGARYD